MYRDDVLQYIIIYTLNLIKQMFHKIAHLQMIIMIIIRDTYHKPKLHRSFRYTHIFLIGRIILNHYFAYAISLFF